MLVIWETPPQGTKLLNSMRFTLDSREALLATIGVRGLD